MAKNDAGNGHVVENGDIFFLFRPMVNEAEPSGPDDVQRFYMVLRPSGGGKVRPLVVGRKHLPDVGSHERLWGFVDAIAASGADLEKEFREDTYETKTRGEQTQPAARPAGEGVYAVTLEDGQLHLAYALELPDEKGGGPVQRAFGIAPEASFALSIKNPEKSQPKGAGLSGDQEADYPKRLQEEFRGRRFAREDIELLDREGAEFILVGARRNPEQAYDIDLDTEHENYDSAEAIRYLRMVKSRHPVEPLFQGRWTED